MYTRRLGAFALLSTGVFAFKNTSPFFLYSSSSLSLPIEPVQLASADSLNAEIAKAVSGCPSDAYIIVSQPGVADVDFATKNSAPHLQKWMNSTSGSSGRSAWMIPEVVGQVNPDLLSNEIAIRCRATVVEADPSTGTIPSEEVIPRIIKIDFDGLHARSIKERTTTLAEHDSFLHAVVSSQGDASYTIFYLTTPPSESLHRTPPTYSMDSKYESVLHTDLKRDTKSGHSNSSDRLHSGLPLFEKYQFFNAGIFVGLFITILLLSILYVGINAISSLEVSYFAFSKEMGPSAQKKQ